jgi:hypothetical protein
VLLEKISARLNAIVGVQAHESYLVPVFVVVLLERIVKPVGAIARLSQFRQLLFIEFFSFKLFLHSLFASLFITLAVNDEAGHTKLTLHKVNELCDTSRKLLLVVSLLVDNGVKQVSVLVVLASIILDDRQNFILDVD